MGERLYVLIGVDDLIVEGLAAGACGWVAGLVNAFPRESVLLFELAPGRCGLRIAPGGSGARGFAGRCPGAGAGRQFR